MERRMIVYPGQTSRVTEKALLAPFFVFLLPRCMIY